MAQWLPETGPATEDPEVATAIADEQARLLARYWDEMTSVESTISDIGYWLNQAGRNS